MENLPPELIDRITFYLEPEDLKQTLVVSRIFQDAAERHSGAFNAFRFTCDDHEPSKFPDAFKETKDGRDNWTKFLEIYSGRRLRYLRYVEVHTSFPPLKCTENDPEEWPCRESRDELRVKDEDFTKQIKRVFETLKALEDHGGQAHSTRKIELTIFTPFRWVDDVFCRHHVSSAWRVHLLRPEELPELPYVHSFSICNPEDISYTNYGLLRKGRFWSPSRLDYRVLIDIASRLPNLQYLGCRLGIQEGRLTDENPARKHFEHDYEACARDSRHDFAKALESVKIPASLKYAQLDFVTNSPQHTNEERGKAPNFLIGQIPQDPFSTNLRIFASNLRHLDIRLMADSSLFWPAHGSVSWPNLEHLNITFHTTTPSGSWYFRGLPGAAEVEDEDGYEVTDDMYPPLESNTSHDLRWHRHDSLNHQPHYVEQFQIIPREETLHPFLAAFAKSASNMHALKSASLSALLDDLDDEVWGVAYSQPGEFATLWGPQRNERSSARELWWSVGAWRPDASLHELFQGIGAAKHGGDMTEYWNFRYYGGDMLLGPEVFKLSLAALPRSDRVYSRMSCVKDYCCPSGCCRPPLRDRIIRFESSASL
ncbi:hypothetical protein K504DRAFT_461134 [Pleomassaria siparia CBS 279.74]|uniref:F-box domain-containing protein n=1 Tax=Pleomassaria siparia CBS 279.74 TaxID=1314801 RepID=A0A6G1JX20_9PLEO|nr:hypothetical protein K504DRAFT_461134 [Pleomassaria siparia CBS 279.74]